MSKSGSVDRRSLNLGVYGARGIPSTYSGYETFLTELLPNLAERGHRVTMYCRKGDIEPLAEYRGVRLRHVAAVDTKSLSTLTHGALAALAARAARHDVVLVVNVANALPAALATRTGQSVVLNTDGQEWLRGKWGPLAKRVFLTSARIAARSATSLVSDCRGMADVYRDVFGAESSTVIPYMYLPGTTPDPSRLPRDFGVRADEFVVTGGRLVPENNADRVTEAYLRTTSPLPLLVLGAANYDSPVLTRLKQLAAQDERVVLVGHVSDRQAFISLLAGARRYVHAHTVGGINPSLVEAMGSGAAVLALDTRFNREALGEAGWYFTDFESSLIGALGAACRDADLTEEIRKESRRRATELFAPEAVVDAYEQLLLWAAETPSRDKIAITTRWS